MSLAERHGISGWAGQCLWVFMIGAHLRAVNHLGETNLPMLKKHPQHSRPLLFGVLAGSLVPTLSFTLLLAFSSVRILIPVLPAAIVAFLILLFSSAIAGLPLAILLRSYERLTAIPFCLAGVIVGTAITSVLNFQMNYWPQMNDPSFARWIAWSSAMRSIAFGAIVSAISSVSFCLGAGIRIRRR